MAPDYKKQLARAIQNQRAAEANRKSSFADDRVAAHLPANILSIKDVAEILTDALATQRHEILEHVGRQLTLIKLKQTPDDNRFHNLNRRLFEVESLLRRMQKGGSR